MCSTNHSNWVTFEDDGIPLSPPQKPLQSPGHIKGSSLTGSTFVPCNAPFCTPVSGVPGSTSPFHSSTWEKNDLFHSFSSTSASSVPSVGSEGTAQTLNQTSDGPTPFPSFQENSGHSNPFWEGSRHSTEVGSSSSDSESDNNLPRFFIRTKDGDVPSCEPLQGSYSYICHKLEGLRVVNDQEAEREGGEEGQLRCKTELRTEVIREGSPQFVPRGLFRSQKRDGWSLMLRIPEKKNRMSSRQWGPIYVRLLPGGVLQMYYEKGLEKPFKEFQLFPHCRLSEVKLESYSEPRKVLTVKVEHFSYTEKKRFHPKPEVSHEAEVDQLLKFGTTAHDDMEDLVASMEEELFQLCMPHQQRRHYEEQELSLQITDHIWVQLDKTGGVMERAASTQIHCLTFLNGQGDCFLALNDLGLLRLDSSYGSEEGNEVWMEITDSHFHKCVNETEFQRSRLIKFSPPDACRVELMRYKTAVLGCTELPFSVKAVVTVQGAYVELQAFLNMSASFPSSMGVSDTYPLCENVVIRVPVPGDWVRVSQTVTLLRQRSLKARMNRNACLGPISAGDSQPVMQVSVGTVKYENVYSAIVWKIDRLPAKNTAVDHPHSFSCKLQLASDQEIPNDWYPFVTMECEIMGAVVSQTRIKSLGTANDIQPQKHVTSWTRYHCQAKLYLSIIDDVIESVRELFLDEGLEDRVLDDLRHLWESKMMQCKAMEDFRKNNINLSNFVLQLPANYSQTDQELSASVVIPASQNSHSFPSKNSSEALATFSLSAGFAYPVQIPAGVTLQTASGQLYKVNVPVVVTQAPAGQQPFTQLTQKVIERRDAPAMVPPATVQPREMKQSAVLAPPDTHLPRQKNHLPPSRESSRLQQPRMLQGARHVEFTVTRDEFSPRPVNPSTTSPSSSCSQLLNVHISAEKALAQVTKLKTSNIDKVLKEAIQEKRDEAASTRNPAHLKTETQSEAKADAKSEADLRLDLAYSYSDLSTIIQLDGPADNSDTEKKEEEEEGAPLDENDFLDIINAEAIKALQEVDGSSDGNSISSSSESEAAAHVEDEDPLNSGDDVIEQDIPDLFDTDNVIVCQYDKIHRSKNRWKFYLKDVVMCYGGRDYVFSKAIGEAEW
ncbi:hypothetical protein LDENG_00237710 [Lucifuga dentata]|nr:hypothetical protein LDENG_00237710 [Lucifuga dentata]